MGEKGWKRVQDLVKGDSIYCPFVPDIESILRGVYFTEMGKLW